MKTRKTFFIVLPFIFALGFFTLACGLEDDLSFHQKVSEDDLTVVHKSGLLKEYSYQVPLPSDD